MTRTRQRLTVLALTGLFGFAATATAKDESVALDKVPKAVLETAKKMFPKVKWTEAEKEVEDDTVIYKLEGKLSNGKVYEMEITESGEIIEIELED